MLLCPSPRPYSANPSQAALPWVIASRTSKVVLGVPVSSKLGGLNTLLLTIRMPEGVPAASMGIDNGVNAAQRSLNISPNRLVGCSTWQRNPLMMTLV